MNNTINVKLFLYSNIDNSKYKYIKYFYYINWNNYFL